jgi:AraC-like DNA-binding protein
MQASYLHLLTDLVAGYGVDPALLTRDLSPAVIGRNDRSNLPAAFDALCARALELTNDPALGLRFGERLNISAHGVLGLALMSSASVADALNVLLRYFRILSPASDLNLAQSDAGYCLRLTIRGQSAPVQRFRTEALIGSIVTSSQFLLNRPTPGVDIHLNYEKPAHHERYAQAWPHTHIYFGAAETSVTFPLAMGKWAIGTANPAVADIFRRQCEALLRPLNGDGVVSNRVRLALMRSLDNLPSVDTVARMLAMSERTLRRRLDDEKTSFRTLVDQVRAEMANQYLQQTTLPVTEISRLLGFDNVANFRRAFKRWFGVAPQARRNGGAGQVHDAPL